MSIMAAAATSLLYYNLLTLGKSELEDDEYALDKTKPKKIKIQQNLQDLWPKLYFEPEPKSSSDTSVYHTDKNNQ